MTYNRIKPFLFCYYCICVFSVIIDWLDGQNDKGDYNLVHNKNTYVTESRAINDYLLDSR